MLLDTLQCPEKASHSKELSKMAIVLRFEKLYSMEMWLLAYVFLGYRHSFFKGWGVVI